MQLKIFSKVQEIHELLNCLIPGPNVGFCIITTAHRMNLLHILCEEVLLLQLGLTLEDKIVYSKLCKLWSRVNMSKKIVHTQSAYTFQVEIFFQLTHNWELRPVLGNLDPYSGTLKLARTQLPEYRRQKSHLIFGFLSVKNSNL